MSVFGKSDSCGLSIFLQTHNFWKFDHICRTCNPINYRNTWFAKVIIFIMTAQVLLFDVFYKLKCWAIVHDTKWPLYYTMVSILQWRKTPKQVFVAKYLFLEQDKQIWDKPLCSGHFFAVPMVSAVERFHCNHALFHLWWKENLVKNQKVSKYFENHCLQNFLLRFMSLLTAKYNR